FEAMHAAAEGHSIDAIDAAAKAFGMPMGPVELADTVGLDVCRHVGRIVSQALGRPTPDLAQLDARIAAREFGRKSGLGFYLWTAGKQGGVNPAIATAVAATPTTSADDLTDRLVLALANEAVAVLREKKVESVAVCMLHSYANPAHERRAHDLVKEIWPEAYLCTSSGVLPEFREFERFATTVVNASLMPIMDRYLERFERGVADLGIKVAPRVMQSNGGAVTPGAVRKLPVNTFFSGPAGGVVGSVGLGAELGIDNLITFDMGGTTAKTSFVRDGEPHRSSDYEAGRIERFRRGSGLLVRIPTIDIVEIGAGGGSIARIDRSGVLLVGPESAGATPGPACYARGGTLPT
ncbi:MAG: hypothetical protein EBR15_10325, partial [Gammaproteobacteria bacterium]|nr:hypothetical protein [Gammaproteobacteria bacterium]